MNEPKRMYAPHKNYTAVQLLRYKLHINKASWGEFDEVVTVHTGIFWPRSSRQQTKGEEQFLSRRFFDGLLAFSPLWATIPRNSMKTLVDFFVKSIKNNAKHRHNESLLGGFFNRKSLPAVRIGGEMMLSANKLLRRRESMQTNFTTDEAILEISSREIQKILTVLSQQYWPRCDWKHLLSHCKYQATSASVIVSRHPWLYFKMWTSSTLWPASPMFHY